MEQEETKGFHWIYLLAASYVIAAYMSPALSFIIVDAVEESSFLPWIPLAAPIALSIVSLIVILANKKRIGRIRLLQCAVFIKFAMIPFYIIGGLVIVLFILLMFTPVIIMVFVSPVAVTILSVFGWLYMAGVAPYSVTYLSESTKAGVHGKKLCVLASILQFFFTADVISIMVMALKEKKCIRLILTMLGLLIIGFIGCVVLLTVMIITA